MGVPKVTCPSALLPGGLDLRMPGYPEVDDECWLMCVCGEWRALALWMVLKCHTASIINYLQTKVSRRGNKVITSEHFDRLSFVRSFVIHTTLTCFPIFN